MASHERSAMPPAEASSLDTQREGISRQGSADWYGLSREEALRRAPQNEMLRTKALAKNMSPQKVLCKIRYVFRFKRHAQQLMGCSSAMVNRKRSPLLRLPAELRNMVYDYVFNDSHYRFHQFLHTDRRPDESEPHCSGTFRSNNLGLLLTSRQLRKETALLPYKLGVFRFHFEEILPEYHPYEDIVEKAFDAHKESGLKEDEWWLDVVRDFLYARSAKQIEAIGKLEVDTDGLFEITSESQTGAEWAAEVLESDSEE